MYGTHQDISASFLQEALRFPDISDHCERSHWTHYLFRFLYHRGKLIITSRCQRLIWKGSFPFEGITHFQTVGSHGALRDQNIRSSPSPMRGQRCARHLDSYATYKRSQEPAREDE